MQLSNKYGLTQNHKNNHKNNKKDAQVKKNKKKKKPVKAARNVRFRETILQKLRSRWRGPTWQMMQMMEAASRNEKYRVSWWDFGGLRDSGGPKDSGGLRDFEGLRDS